MFGIDSSELLLVAIVALVVIGPKDLPKAMRVVGYWVGRARGVARQFRQGFDNMVREAELEEMEKKWAAENERIMREHPAPAEPATDSPPDQMSGDEMPHPVMVEKPAVEPGADAAVPPVSVEHPVVEPARSDTPPAPDKAPS